MQDQLENVIFVPSSFAVVALRFDLFPPINLDHPSLVVLRINIRRNPTADFMDIPAGHVISIAAVKMCFGSVIGDICAYRGQDGDTRLC